MFERYTERARRTIFFARFEATQFGSSYIESEHLLLGILREDRTLAEKLLGPNALRNVRSRIEEQTPVRAKVSSSADLPLSHESKRILAYGAEEAKNLGHEHIDSGHLLAGALMEKPCFAARILDELRLKLPALREQLTQSQALRTPSASKPILASHLANFAPAPGTIRYCPAASWVLALARYEAAQFASPRIQTEHLLLGLLFEDRELAKRILKPGESVDSLRQQLPHPEIAKSPDPTRLTYSDECQRILQTAAGEAGDEPISLDDLLIAILKERDCTAAKILRERSPGPL